MHFPSRKKLWFFKKSSSLSFDATAQWPSLYSVSMGSLTFSLLWRWGMSVQNNLRLYCCTWADLKDKREGLGSIQICVIEVKGLVLFIYWKPSGSLSLHWYPGGLQGLPHVPHLFDNFLFFGVKTFGLWDKIWHCETQWILEPVYVIVSLGEV